MPFFNTQSIGHTITTARETNTTNTKEVSINIPTPNSIEYTKDSENNCTKSQAAAVCNTPAIAVTRDSLYVQVISGALASLR